MTDVKLLLRIYGSQDDEQDDDDCSRYFESSMLDQSNPGDILSPLEKLKKYCTNENIFTRQMVARSVVEAAQSVTSEEECLSFLAIVTKLSDDAEPSVRCELMEQLPPVCMVIVGLKVIPDAVSGFILPVIVKYLTDSNNQVRKLSQTALLQLMEQHLIDPDDVEKQICPVLLQLTEPDSGDDYRTEAVTLMTKLTPLIGADMAERLFLHRFGDLCRDPLFHVRKVCASNFGDISSVLRQETTENVLLPLFARLCEDGVWGVKKACAEAFVAVSGACSRRAKYDKLSPVFVGLLCDKSRWVQMAAYEALGRFIATFSDPARSGFEIADDGSLVPFKEFRGYDLDSPPPLEDPYGIAQLKTYGESSDNRQDAVQLCPRPEGLEPPVVEFKSSNDASPSILNDLSPSPEEIDSYFDNFEYWRTPIPYVSLPVEVQTSSSSLQYESSSQPADEMSSLSAMLSEKSKHAGGADPEFGVVSSSPPPSRLSVSESSRQNSSTSTDSSNNSAVADSKALKQRNMLHDLRVPAIEILEDDGDVSSDGTSDAALASESVSTKNAGTAQQDRLSEHPADAEEMKTQERAELIMRDFLGYEDDFSAQRPGNNRNAMVDDRAWKNQHVVPYALLEHYLSMTEPSKAQSIDCELAKHCAFTLPGVALALGRNNWHCLKDTYDLLTTDMQWKVRRTLAFSIHDLAKILGEDITVADLVPVFNSFLKDLDEVRVGVLKHLNDFIQLLPSDLQKDYLGMFADFRNPDNARNWRFRQDLVEQLMQLVALYDAQELGEFFVPVALSLAGDKVAEVREGAFQLLCLISRRLRGNSHLYHKFATNIVTLGVHHQHWVRRKACVQIYLKFLKGDVMETNEFARDFLASLLNLSADDVPNIRLLSAQALLLVTRSSFYLGLSHDDETRQLVQRAIEVLQSDVDRDVRYFSGGKTFEASGRQTRREERDSDVDVRMVRRGIQDYHVQDDDEDDCVLEEEVYMEEGPENAFADDNPKSGFVGETVVISESRGSSQSGTGLGASLPNLETVHATEEFIEEFLEEVDERPRDASVPSES